MLNVFHSFSLTKYAKSVTHQLLFAALDYDQVIGFAFKMNRVRVMAVVMNREVSRKESIYSGSVYEANLYKWLQSEKLGYDLGEKAIREWYKQYWGIYCRIKRLAHVVGQECLQEFDDGPSVLILGLLQSNDLLLQLILDRVSEGWENFDVINWAIDWDLPTIRVREILEELNINCARMDPVISTGETG